jgi:hypothetical protein
METKHVQPAKIVPQWAQDRFTESSLTDRGSGPLHSNHYIIAPVSTPARGPDIDSDHDH